MMQEAQAGSSAAAAASPEKKEAETKPAAPKPKKRRRLKVAHPERCIGCLGCMFACSRTYTGAASPQDSAIKIQTQGGIEGDFRVVVCRGCNDPPCVRACPAGALERKPDGNVVFHQDLCTDCGKCQEACLVGAMTLGKERKPIKSHNSLGLKGRSQN